MRRLRPRSRPGQALAAEGAIAAGSLAELVEGSTAPRAIWVMLPAGGPTEATIDALSVLLSPGDAIIDGGNTFWRDDIRRGAALERTGLHYIDVGTSGGVWGLERGYCMMIGGDEDEVHRLDPIFAALAPGLGYDPADAGPRAIATRASSRATCTPVPAAPAISSRWSITASNTA